MLDDERSPVRLVRSGSYRCVVGDVAEFARARHYHLARGRRACRHAERLPGRCTRANQFTTDGDVVMVAWFYFGPIYRRGCCRLDRSALLNLPRCDRIEHRAGAAATTPAPVRERTETHAGATAARTRNPISPKWRCGCIQNGTRNMDACLYVGRAEQRHASVKGDRGAQSAGTVRRPSPGGWYQGGASTAAGRILPLDLDRRPTIVRRR